MSTPDSRKAITTTERLFVNAEHIKRAKTICRKRNADYTDAELALLSAVPLARGAGRNGREGLSEDFESAREALCKPWHGTHRPAGQPANSLEHWLKVFMRHPDAAIKIMAMVRADDGKHSENVVYQALRETPVESPLNAVLDRARAINPLARPDDDTAKKTRQRLLKQNISAGLLKGGVKKQGDKKGQKSPP